MKESFWIYFFIVLGILVMIIMMLVQDMTSTSEEDFYLTKEVLEASMVDSVDLGLYRQTGNLRIIESKFVESFVRRFAESVNNSKSYEIDFYEIYEYPPKATVYIKTKSRTVKVSADAESFDILTQMSGILETKESVTTLSQIPGDASDNGMIKVLIGDGVTNKIVTVKSGDTIEKPADPKKDGYTFLGWYYNGEVYDFSLPVYGSFSITAKYIEKTNNKSCIITNAGKNGFIGLYTCTDGVATLTECYYRDGEVSGTCATEYACYSTSANRLSDSCSRSLPSTTVGGGALPYSKSCTCN